MFTLQNYDAKNGKIPLTECKNILKNTLLFIRKSHMVLFQSKHSEAEKFLWVGIMKSCFKVAPNKYAKPIYLPMMILATLFYALRSVQLFQ